MNKPNLRQLKCMLKDTIAFKEVAIKRNYTVILNVIDDDIKKLKNDIANFKE